VLVLQHIAHGPRDAYELELDAADVELITVRVDLGEPIPDWRHFAGLIATGGPMSAVDDRAYPRLAEERRTIREAVEAGVPFWGVCLGAQLLAASLGAQVRRGPSPEVGMATVRLTPDAERDPVFAGAPPEIHTFQWHKDTFALPDGARLLATSAAYENQAFSWRSAYGVQFHLEPSAEVVEHWASRRTGSAKPPVALDGDSLRAMVDRLLPHESSAMELARTFMRRWLQLVRGHAF
jgi:GMP synthase (glutamine-hydrolysing)